MNSIVSAPGRGLERVAEVLGIHEHHGALDFDAIRRSGVRAVVVRAGRGTRQDSRWIEYCLQSRSAGLATGSFWLVRPSRAGAYLQAELWASAIQVAGGDFAAGHWAQITTTDDFDGGQMASYVRSFLGRIDELLPRPVGVATAADFWSRAVGLDLAGRPTTDLGSGSGAASTTELGTRIQAALVDPGSRDEPGRLLTSLDLPCLDDSRNERFRLVERRPDETADQWRARWTSGDDVRSLQHRLNDAGATLFIDGIFGPETAAAFSILEALRRRDG